MSGREQIEQLGSNLLALGVRRLTILALAGITVFSVIGVGSYYLSKPELEKLYTGLTPSDISRIGAALEEAGVTFDVNAERTAVLVRHSQLARARMLLAEKGLPSSANAGYELFDKLGSMGLTSFMQEITRVRALEGEIARTVQAMKGVKAVRVHIVMPNAGSFRRKRQPPSASVVIRTDLGSGFSSAPAIRHLVAAAVPGMTIDNVTILSTDGTVLSSGEDTASAASGRMVGLERTVSTNLQDNVRRTLAPYLGLENFQISVTARLNTDKQQTAETKFDPESRVERSVRVVKETGNSNNTSSSGNVGVEQNLPEEEAGKSGGDKSSQNKERREELTNYELNTKTTKTASDGYKIEKLSIAVVINKDQLMSTLGKTADAAAIDAHLKDVKALIASAAGIDLKRGDQITVSALKFHTSKSTLEPIPEPPLTDYLMRQTGGLVKSLAFVVVALMLIMFGLRPMTKALTALPATQTAQLAPGTQAGMAMAGAGGQMAAGAGQMAAGGMAQGDQFQNGGVPGAMGGAGGMPAGLPEGMQDNVNRTPQKRLEQMIDRDEEQAAAIMKQWMREAEQV